MTPQPAPSRPDDPMATIFASMVMQQTQMTLMLLGQMPHPETGEVIMDLEGAKMFIDQLEMLAVKTKGNLGKDEEQLLQQSLVGTRMAFVDASERQGRGAQSAPLTAMENPAPQSATDLPAAEEESRRKFSKKY